MSNGYPDRRPPMGGPYPSQDNLHHNDPFSDAAPAVYVQQPPIPGMPPRRSPQPFESTATLPQDFTGQTANYPEHDYDEEKVPLTGGQGYAGGLYPPGG